jgi:dihydrofolate synthase/folylpolyglutamate synthase
MRADRVAICADDQAPLSIGVVAGEVGARLLSVGVEWSFAVKTKQSNDSHGNWSMRARGAAGDEVLLSELPVPSLPLPSVAAAIQSLISLGLEVSPERLRVLIPAMNLTGRFQKREVLGRSFILDVAHNPAAAELLAKRLSLQLGGQKILAIVGMMSDKDRQACLGFLAPLVSQWLPVSLPHIPRASSGLDLQADLKELGVDLPSVQVCDTVAQAIEVAIKGGQYGQHILIMGSFFTVADALKELDRLDGSIGTEE